MQNIFINFVEKIIYKNNALTDSKKEIIRYGLSGIYTTISKLLILMIISLLLNIFNKFLVIFGFYALIKSVSYGMHARSSKFCLILSIVFLILPVYLIQIITIGLTTKIIILVYTFIIFARYAPSDTANRPLVNKKHRLNLKLYTLLIFAFYAFVSLITTNEFLAYSIIYILLLQSIIIHPWFYQINKQSYQNYRKGV